MTDPNDPIAPQGDPLMSVARRLLEQEGAFVDSAPGVADGAVRASEKLCAHLERVVGPIGISTLFTRSLFLTRPRFPWLVSDPHGGHAGRWQALRSCLEAQGADAAREASLSLVGHLLRLLGGLIGDALVLRLLTEVWPDDLPTRTKEETP